MTKLFGCSTVVNNCSLQHCSTCCITSYVCFWSLSYIYFSNSIAKFSQLLLFKSKLSLLSCTNVITVQSCLPCRSRLTGPGKYSGSCAFCNKIAFKLSRSNRVFPYFQLPSCLNRCSCRLGQETGRGSAGRLCFHLDFFVFGNHRILFFFFFCLFSTGRSLCTNKGFVFL